MNGINFPNIVKQFFDMSESKIFFQRKFIISTLGISRSQEFRCNFIRILIKVLKKEVQMEKSNDNGIPTKTLSTLSFLLSVLIPLNFY